MSTQPEKKTHIQTPLELVIDEGGFVIDVKDSTGVLFSSLDYNQHRLYEEHMIRCVNAHDALVSACRAALSVIPMIRVDGSFPTNVESVLLDALKLAEEQA